MKTILACAVLMLTATASQAQVAHELQGEERGWTEEEMRNAIPMEKTVDENVTPPPVIVDVVPSEPPVVVEGYPGEPSSEGSALPGQERAPDMLQQE